MRGDEGGGVRVGYLRAVFEADKEAALEAFARLFDCEAPIFRVFQIA